MIEHILPVGTHYREAVYHTTDMNMTDSGHQRRRLVVGHRIIGARIGYVIVSVLLGESYAADYYSPSVICQ